MTLTKSIVIALACGISCTSLLAYASAESTSTYQNKRGSVMTLNFHPEEKNTGSITGTFTSAVGNCKTDVNSPMPLTGYFNGNVISVTVNFPHCKVVAAMTGNLTKNNEKLHMLWIVSSQAQDPQRADWNTNNIGSDSYKKIS